MKMKTRLSAWKYVKNNKRVVGVLVTSLALSFMAMYVIHVLLSTTSESFRPVMFEMPKHISYASLTPKAFGINRDDYENYEEFETALNEKRDEVIENLKKHPGIDNVILTQVALSHYQPVVGEIAYEAPLLEADQIRDFLDHMGAKLVDGRMPECDGEVLVDTKLMKNAGTKIGDWFSEGMYGETFKIVGVIESSSRICVGTPMGNTNSGWYMVVYNDESTMDLKAVLEAEGLTITEQDTIYDSLSYKKMYEKDVDGVIQDVILAISLVVTIFLSLLVLVAYVSFLRDRVSEYCLYASIGYGRAEIYGMILREMVLLFLIGTVSGLIISLGAGILIEELVIWPRGLEGSIFYGERILTILGIFLLLMGILQIPVLAYVNRIKTVDMIEEQ